MKSLLLLTLNTFSATGGIEKVCQLAGKALHELSEEQHTSFDLYAMHDAPGIAREQYLPIKKYKGFGGSKVRFVLEAIKKGRQSDVVILSHINLLSIGFLIKIISPRTKLFLIAHGIEVWQPLSFIKRKMFSFIDIVLAVSNFTKEKLVAGGSFAAHKIQVINNCIDPFLNLEDDPTKQANLKKKYGFTGDDFILFTLTRLKFSEQYKGYDKVITAMKELINAMPSLKYIIVGKYDEQEKARIDLLLQINGLKDAVVFAGFIPDEEMAAHFNMADVYIMPSTGEGFGIVFIEALYYGKPVIAGNKDGSVDALANGRFGILVNPDDQQEIIAAIKKIKENKISYVPDHKEVVKKFGFDTYKNAWRTILFDNMINIKASGNSLVASQ